MKRLLILLYLLAVPCLDAQQRAPARHQAFDAEFFGWPVRSVEYTPPFIYAEWWKEIAECEGFPVPDSAQQKSVQWFVVSSRYFFLDFSAGAMLAGTWDREPSIYMGRPYVWEEGIVKHEMLHVILYWSGYELKNFHPAELFEICGIHATAEVHD